MKLTLPLSERLYHGVGYRYSCVGKGVGSKTSQVGKVVIYLNSEIKVCIPAIGLMVNIIIPSNKVICPYHCSVSRKMILCTFGNCWWAKIRNQHSVRFAGCRPWRSDTLIGYDFTSIPLPWCPSVSLFWVHAATDTRVFFQNKCALTRKPLCGWARICRWRFVLGCHLTWSTVVRSSITGGCPPPSTSGSHALWWLRIELRYSWKLFVPSPH